MNTAVNRNNKRPRKVLTTKEKADIVRKVEKEKGSKGVITRVALEVGVPINTVSGIWKQRAAILEKWESGAGSTKSFNSVTIASVDMLINCAAFRSY